MNLVVDSIMVVLNYSDALDLCSKGIEISMPNHSLSVAMATDTHRSSFSKFCVTKHPFWECERTIHQNFENMNLIGNTQKEVTITMVTSLIIVTHRGSTTTSPHNPHIYTQSAQVVLNASDTYYLACANFSLSSIHTPWQ